VCVSGLDGSKIISKMAKICNLGTNFKLDFLLFHTNKSWIFPNSSLVVTVNDTVDVMIMMDDDVDDLTFSVDDDNNPKESLLSIPNRLFTLNSFNLTGTPLPYESQSFCTTTAGYTAIRCFFFLLLLCSVS